MALGWLEAAYLYLEVVLVVDDDDKVTVAVSACLFVCYVFFFHSKIPSYTGTAIHYSQIHIEITVNTNDQRVPVAV